VDDAGLMHLAHGTLLEHLCVLDLRNNRVGRAGLQELIGSPASARLRQLSLMHNHLTDEVVPLLVNSNLIQQLALLDLRGNRFSPSAIRQFDRFGPRVRTG
jgi:hypothetical protein